MKNLNRLASDAEEIFVYFKHESSAPDLAMRLRAKLDSKTRMVDVTHLHEGQGFQIIGAKK